MNINHKKTILPITSVFVLLGILFLLSVTNHIEDERMDRVIFISKSANASTDFWFSLMEGAKVAAKEYNIQLEIVSPDQESDYGMQNELIQSAIQEKPDGIILCPADAVKTKEGVEDILENKIPLLFLDSALQDDLEVPIVATNNTAAGEKLGSYMKQSIQGDTLIAIVGHVEGASTAQERIAGIKTALGKEASRIVNIVYCDSDYEKAYELTYQMLKSTPEIQMIAGTNENAAVGAARAVQELGLSGSVSCYGFDSSKEEIELLEEGVFEAIVVQKAFNMGYLAVEATATKIHGNSVEEYIDSGSKLITKDNMYIEENQKLLFPFW